MGADLYLESVYGPARRKWEPKFNAAAAERDRHAEGTPERARWQKRVSRYYDKMYGEGYFRDPYNDWEVLAKFGLSWWTGVIPQLDPQRFLAVADAARLLTQIEEQEAQFAENLAELSPQDARYFRQRAKELKAFLRTAIDRNEPIRCSL
jgi:hypothetical protein